MNILFVANNTVCFLVTCLLFPSLGYCNTPQTVIDLSYTYDASTVYWPTERDEGFKFTKSYNSTDPVTGEHYEAYSFCTPEHGGTHLDAPNHFTAGKYGVDAIPITKLVNPGVVIDVSQKTSNSRDYQVNASDFEEWERQYGNIQKDTIVLLFTGWGGKLPNLTEYFGTATKNESLLHFPGLSEQGALWLVNKKIACVGIDTASIDYGQSTSYAAHKVLTAAEIPIFENVANLHRVPTKGAMVVALPMKIGRGSGAPLRIIAYYDDKPSNSVASKSTTAFTLMAVVMSILLSN